MAFHPGDLPSSVQSLFNKNIHTPILWPVVIEEAVKQGIRDVNTLANIIFYLHHPDLIGSPLQQGQKDFQKLSAEWLAWRDVARSSVGGFSKPAAPSEWECYTSSTYPQASYLPASVKGWLKQPPAHDREAAVFESNSLDGTRRLMFLAWKTADAKSNCMTHNLHADQALHGWLERQTSLAAIKASHGLKTDWLSVLGYDAGAKGIAAMNLGLNKLMFHYAFKKGLCIQRAHNIANRKLREEAKAIMEIVSGVVSGASAAKSPGTAPLPSRHHAPLKLSELDWKGFVKQIYDIAKGDYGKAADINEGTSSLTIHDRIRDETNAVVGLVRYFD